MLSSAERRPVGKLVIPVAFGKQVITSLLFNHDANPVHHRPDHAVQWLLGLLSTNAIASAEDELADADPEERTYTLGAQLLSRQDVVVMPGAILASICYECFVQPHERTVSITTHFTYPLLVPTKGRVPVEVEAFELRSRSNNVDPEIGEARHLLIEAYGPGITGHRVQLMKLEAVIYAPETSADLLYEKIVAGEFESLRRKADSRPDLPNLKHPAAISEENRRQYARIVGADRRITPATWQAKIPRALTEITDHLRTHESYKSQYNAYYEGREDEADRRRAIERYVQKERKYRSIQDSDVGSRIEKLAGLIQRLYARQHTVFDPRLFVDGGAALEPGQRFTLDLRLFQLALRRGIHRFFTGAHVEQGPVFMGEALIGGQALVTKRLVDFLYEINHSFDNLALFEYRH